MSFNTFTYESGPSEYDDFPFTGEPVYILGEVYSAQYDREELKDDIRSRLWITYRRNFANIGGTGPSSDQNWGCMLRCGQMMLAQALVVRHLGRDWRWKQGQLNNETYWKLLKMFEDKKTAIYSIHQIASMGEAEGKAIGQWFGPNTIAQVLKRITVFDGWSDIAIHIALDNVVILDEVNALCKSQSQVATNGDIPGLPDGETFSNFVNDAKSNQPPSQEGPGKSSSKSHPSQQSWKPLLLIIPLRLGLTEINPIYFDSLKKCLTLRQSVGIIGGKPNHAHWFIGYFGKELIYLDPHTTQPVVDLEDRGPCDTSYHCLSPPSRMSFHKLDPSIALGFYCHTEKDFLDLCSSLQTYDKGAHAMFEIRKDAPKVYYCENDKKPKPSASAGARNRQPSFSADFTLVSSSSCVDTASVDDEEFEII